ncbi:MAG: hypothetical protein AAF281_01945 [Pseudomonadota bacterium]
MTKLGHNKGPALVPGAGWRSYCWRRARADLVGAKLPIEIVRQRVRRARELGLAYPHYARVLMGSGRDIVGFLFTCDALGLRLRRRLEMPNPVRDKLATIKRADLLALAPEGEAPEAFRRELVEISNLDFAAAGETPAGRPWRFAGTAIQATLSAAGLPGRGVVLVAEDAAQAWVVPGRLGGFVAADAYFTAGEQGPS